MCQSSGAIDVIFGVVSGANRQERILETSLAQKGGFIKTRGQDS